MASAVSSGGGDVGAASGADLGGAAARFANGPVGLGTGAALRSDRGHHWPDGSGGRRGDAAFAARGGGGRGTGVSGAAAGLPGRDGVGGGAAAGEGDAEPRGCVAVASGVVALSGRV